MLTYNLENVAAAGLFHKNPVQHFYILIELIKKTVCVTFLEHSEILSPVQRFFYQLMFIINSDLFYELCVFTLYIY